MSEIISATGPRTGSDSPVLSSEVHRLRRDFPILDQTIGDAPLVYLDNAATSHKPLAVINALQRFYSADNSNIHRGVHSLSERATEEYEQARARIQRFINAARSDEIVFVRGVTEAVNLVAAGFGRKAVRPQDEIVITEMEHHSNIVPWQMLCEQQDALLKVVPVDDNGDLRLDRFEALLTDRTRLVALTHVSNVLGAVNPLREIIEMAHRQNVPVFVDGAQAVPHIKVDVQELGCDFYAFSGHKIYGPTGIGVLYGRSDRLAEMLPYQTGGGAIKSVTFQGTSFKQPPSKFEAGTPNIAGAIGLSAALDYLSALGLERVKAYEDELLDYTVARLSEIPGLSIIGKPRERIGIASFVIRGAHAHDVATILDSQGIAIRAGHHCAQPLHERFGIGATARVSLALYNLKEEIDRLIEGVHLVDKLFKP
ncbi:MAG TPA: cysteine desulfurase [Blastocatellia bacterium]|nr:cysteine desulfurase [Blastocatellia bacterium]